MTGVCPNSDLVLIWWGGHSSSSLFVLLLHDFLGVFSNEIVSRPIDVHRPARTWIKSVHDKKQTEQESRAVHKGEQPDLPSMKGKLVREKVNPFC